MATYGFIHIYVIIFIFIQGTKGVTWKCVSLVTIMWRTLFLMCILVTLYLLLIYFYIVYKVYHKTVISDVCNLYK